VGSPPVPPNIAALLVPGPDRPATYQDPGFATSNFGSYNPPPPDFYHAGQYMDPEAPRVGPVPWTSGGAGACSIAGGPGWNGNAQQPLTVNMATNAENQGSIGPGPDNPF